MSTRGPGVVNGGGSEIDLLGRILRLVASAPTRRLGPRARVELRALVEPRWQEKAACASADPEAWFPIPGATPCRQVTRICAGCPVNRSCLAVAMLWDEHGIWAGTTADRRTQGYRLLRHGVSAAGVVELLLTPARRPRSAGSRWSGAASVTPEVTGSRELPRGGGSDGQEAA